MESTDDGEEISTCGWKKDVIDVAVVGLRVVVFEEEGVGRVLVGLRWLHKEKNISVCHFQRRLQTMIRIMSMVQFMTQSMTQCFCNRRQIYKESSILIFQKRI